MHRYEVDNFASSEARVAFVERQAAVRQVIGVLGLHGSESEPPALGFGGGAMALQGLDTRIEGRTPFDFDCHASWRTLYRLRDEGWVGKGDVRRFQSIGHAVVGHIKSESLLVPVQLFCGEFGRNLTDVLGSTYSGEVRPDLTTEIAGINVARAQILAKSNTKPLTRPKDVAGILKAHVVGYFDSHPILQDEAWMSSVESAMKRIYDGDMQQPLWRYFLLRKPSLPSWVHELKDRRFGHPAFAAI